MILLTRKKTKKKCSVGFKWVNVNESVELWNDDDDGDDGDDDDDDEKKRQNILIVDWKFYTTLINKNTCINRNLFFPWFLITKQ